LAPRGALFLIALGAAGIGIGLWLIYVGVGAVASGYWFSPTGEGLGSALIGALFLAGGVLLIRRGREIRRRVKDQSAAER